MNNYKMTCLDSLHFLEHGSRGDGIYRHQVGPESGWNQTLNMCYYYILYLVVMIAAITALYPMACVRLT